MDGKPGGPKYVRNSMALLIVLSLTLKQLLLIEEYVINKGTFQATKYFLYPNCIDKNFLSLFNNKSTFTAIISKQETQKKQKICSTQIFQDNLNNWNALTNI